MTDDTNDPRESLTHPRRRTVLYGHERAERRILEAWSAGRLHHAFLIAGPEGIGKATFAYRVARFLLRHPDPAAATPSQGLEISGTDTVARLVAARSHPDLAVVEPRFDDRTKRIKREIAADDARVPSAFFGLTAGLGGYRVVIVDAADNLNKTSANALLKILEEPPPRAIFLIVTHAPGSLLPTIRSRCIRLDLAPLDTATVERILGEIIEERGGDPELVRQAAELSRGSPGRAHELLNAHVTGHFSRFRKLVAAGPPFNRKDALEIAAGVSGRGSEGDEGWDMFCWLLTDWLTAHARALALAGEDQAPAFAAAHEEITGSLRRTNALNLDRRQTVLEAFQAVEQAAAGRRPTAS
jgi:DNA polymerase III subunit delta'